LPSALSPQYGFSCCWARRFSVREIISCKTHAESTSGGASEDSYEEVTLIKPNLAELLDLLGVPLENDGARPAACRELTTDGSAEVVAL